jgi:predicted RNA binding protein YcfA (HicA-like mRNA interferase family)
MQTMKAHEIRKPLEGEGWREVRIAKHHTYRKNGETVVVPKGRKPVSPGVMREVAAVAGWMWPPR